MTGPVLRIEGLVVEAASGRRILDIPALTVPGGEAVCLRGPSGAGKSTFLYALAGLVRPTAGRVMWDGSDIAAMTPRAAAEFRRAHLGFVFQEHLLFEELTAAGNAGLAAAYAPRAERRAIRDAAATTLDRLRLDRIAGSRAATLSGGERQRVAVARALAGNPPAILADEPTASLDRANADRLTADLVGLARGHGRTLVAVSHDAHLHAAVDRVIDLADGRIVARAPAQVA